MASITTDLSVEVNDDNQLHVSGCFVVCARWPSLVRRRRLAIEFNIFSPSSVGVSLYTDIWLYPKRRFEPPFYFTNPCIQSRLSLVLRYFQYANTVGESLGHLNSAGDQVDRR